MSTAVYTEGLIRQWNWPNAISVSRIVVGIMLPLWWLLGTEWLIAAIVYAGVSDWLDGHLARQLGKGTPVGAVIDPIADKVFTDLFLIALAVVTGSPAIILLAVVTMLYDLDNTYQRRFDIANACLGKQVPPSKPVTLLSKTKTAVLFVFMVYAVVPPAWQLELLSVDSAALGAAVLVLSSWWLNRRSFLIRLWQS